MNEMICVENEMKSLHRKSGYSHSKEIWEAVMGTCEKLRLLYQHTFPAMLPACVKSTMLIRSMGMRY